MSTKEEQTLFDASEITVSMGPQHPSTHGVLQVKLKLDGERVIDEVRKSRDADHDLVIVGGGDGTVSGVASALAGTDKTMAVLPLGTLNHFALRFAHGG